MIELPEHSVTREDLLEAAVDLLQHVRDRLGDLIIAVQHLPDDREATAALLDDIAKAGDLGWNVLETYIRTMDCRGNC